MTVYLIWITDFNHAQPSITTKSPGTTKKQLVRVKIYMVFVIIYISQVKC